MLGNIIAAGANILGGIMGRDAQKDANAASAAAAANNIKLQKKFAQEGIRWRVKDAKEAGIHPIYALGAQTPSYTPVSQSFTPESGLATGLAAAGQNIGRAVNATRTQPERIEARQFTRLQLEGLQLDNEIKRATFASAVQRLQQNQNPPVPTFGAFDVPEKKKAEERQPLMLDGNRVLTDRGTSPGNAWEDQLGDDVFSPGFLPNLIGMIKQNTKGMSFIDILRAIDRKTAIW